MSLNVWMIPVTKKNKFAYRKRSCSYKKIKRKVTVEYLAVYTELLLLTGRFGIMSVSFNSAVMLLARQAIALIS